MKPSLDKLQKFFRLEAEREYDNRAVLGGLENMLPTWQAEARADNLDEILVNAVTTQLRNYARLSGDQRSEALKALWRRIQSETGMRENGNGDTQTKATRRKAKLQIKKPASVLQAAKVKSQPSKAVKVSIPNRDKTKAEPAALDARVTSLNGVGPVNAARLEKLGIQSLRDMLYHFPRRYDDYSHLATIGHLRYGQEVTVIGKVKLVANRSAGKGRMHLTEVIIDDGSAALRTAWFNQPWMAKNFHEGDQVVFSGTVEQFQGRFTLNNPGWELLDDEQLHTNRIVPVYPLTAQMGQRWLRGLMNMVVSYWAPRIPELLPKGLIQSAELLPLSQALQQAHFPDSQELLKAARQRLAFDELFLLQLAVLQQKKAWQGIAARRFEAPTDWLQAQVAQLPFQLTKAQSKVLHDLTKDLASGRPMNRLLEGDVGAGKTVMAALCMALVAREGAQAALMAPTSILAEQHYATLRELLFSLGGTLQPEELRLIVGATPQEEKQAIRHGLKSGAIKIVVGTHALIEDPILFSELEMVVIDEQHRFGVGQRAALRAKGHNPHLLVMTATPIPRSLALTLYGDLDLSVIDELPPGRQEVNTHILLPHERQRAYGLVQKEVEAGRQAFIIYPLIEENENNQIKAAVQEHKRLQTEIFPNMKLVLLHGRLSAEEKDESMGRFRDGKAQILVSTTVIEVGVDVPNATVMLIEGANRFGLAQLHQLRGRVGRGGEKSYCLLIPEQEEAAENDRLKALTETNDGFLLAERDLEQRGSGQFLGRQQSGFNDLRLASLSDARLIDKARRHAEELLAGDPDLNQPEHHALAAALQETWSDGQGDLS